LLDKTSEEKIETCILLSIEYNFINDFYKKMIEKANSNTNELNNLLKYIDYYSEPKDLLNQYGTDVRIADINDELKIA
jgi:hypothetical protein